MEMPNINFQVSLFGNFEKFNDVISKIRVRIFYKGINRNNTYITEEFAEKLLKTLPYTPIKGIYDNDSEDYTDHGKSRSQGKVYGVVPENPNLTWEIHLDEDGVEREYACCDALIFTGTYEEASELIGKPQSMELYSKTIKGEWKIIQNKKVFEFSDGCFLGLMALGEDTEPCFEGAAFFSLFNQLKTMIKEIETFTNNENQKFKLEGGVEKMNINFKLSDNQKHDAIWALLNTNYTQEANWVVDFAICDIFDDYALCYEYNTSNYYRVAYQKDDETDSVSLGEKTRTYIMDVSETELDALKALRTMNNESFEKIDEVFTENNNSIVTLTSEKAILESEKATFEEEKAVLENEKTALAADVESKDTTIGELNSIIENLKNEKTALETYKTEVEKKEKDVVIEKYSLLLSEDIISKYDDEELTKYSVVDLEKELSYQLTTTNPSIFSKDNKSYFPKIDEPVLTGAEKILAQRKNKIGGDR